MASYRDFNLKIRTLNQLSAFARGIRGAEGALALVDRSKFSKQALDLFIFTQTKEQSERFSCSPVAGRGLPAGGGGGGGGDGPSGGGAGGASAETHGVAGCPPRRSLVRRLSLSSPPFYSFVGGGGGGGGVFVCRVSCTLGVRRKSSTKKRKKNFLIAYVMRPIVGLVDANSLRPKQTNLVWDVTVLGLFSKCCYVCPLVKHVVRSWWVWHITIRTFRL